MGRPGSFDFGLEGKMFGTEFDFGDSSSDHWGDSDEMVLHVLLNLVSVV